MPGYQPLSLYDMILNNMPQTRDPGSQFQQGMASDPQAKSWLSMPWFPSFLGGGTPPDQSGAQPDQGANQQPDPNNPNATVTPSPAAPSRMQPRNAMNLSMLGLAMMSPRAQNAPRPLPWL